jgi:hypothetical protein
MVEGFGGGSGSSSSNKALGNSPTDTERSLSPAQGARAQGQRANATTTTNGAGAGAAKGKGKGNVKRRPGHVGCTEDAQKTPDCSRASWGPGMQWQYKSGREPLCRRVQSAVCSQREVCSWDGVVGERGQAFDTVSSPGPVFVSAKLQTQPSKQYRDLHGQHHNTEACNR